MKLNYDLIKKNLAIYAEAKELFPTISEYERGEVGSNVMRNIGLQYFAEFWDFMKYNDKFDRRIDFILSNMPYQSCWCSSFY
jgi:hypothetical protein